jgi:hypothetical protein
MYPKSEKYKLIHMNKTSVISSNSADRQEPLSLTIGGRKRNS